MSKPKTRRRKRPSSKSKMGNGNKRFRYRESIIRRQLSRLVERWFDGDGSRDYPPERSEFYRYKREG